MDTSTPTIPQLRTDAGHGYTVFAFFLCFAFSYVDRQMVFPFIRRQVIASDICRSALNLREHGRYFAAT